MISQLNRDIRHKVPGDQSATHSFPSPNISRQISTDLLRIKVHLDLFISNAFLQVSVSFFFQCEDANDIYNFLGGGGVPS